MRALILFALSLAACLRSTEFKCENSAQCGAGGQCESTGYCSVADDQCGRRYSPSAGTLAGQCVGGTGEDAGVDSPMMMTDGGIDGSASSCPADYMAVSGSPHMYKLIAAAANWNAQSGACAGTSTHLAVPDDATELAALDTLAGATATYWVGISDSATEGTWKTVTGGTQTFLPWAPGAPTTTPPNNGDDCVRVITANQPAQQFKDDKCNVQIPAICECE